MWCSHCKSLQICRRHERLTISSYAPRLPVETSTLCQKLGVSKTISPHRPALEKSKRASEPLLKPGAPLQRRSFARPRRTLERVLTDERTQSRRNSVPSLTRSATEPALAQIKREVTETSLTSIPLNRVAMAKRYNQREVDLQGASQADDKKSKRKMAIAQELQGAIAALRKPNARAAVKDFVEASDKRHSGLAAKHRAKFSRSNTVGGNDASQEQSSQYIRAVQIQATPSRYGKRGQANVNGNPSSRKHPMLQNPSPISDIPPSSLPRRLSSSGAIPSTTGKNITRPRAAVVRSKTVVDQTPTRGPERFLARPLAGLTFDLPENPTSILQRTPSKSFATYAPSQSSPHQNILATPSKSNPLFLIPGSVQKTAVEVPVKQAGKTASSGSSQTQPQHEEESDIYTALGWDYDVDDV